MDAAKGAFQDVTYVLGKLTKSTGKAAWILGSAFIVLGLPLILILDKDAQLTEFESQQMNALTGSTTSTPAAGSQ